MKRLGVVGLCAAALVLFLGATANAGTYLWNFTDSPSDYWTNDGDGSMGGNNPPYAYPVTISPGSAVVTPIPYAGTYNGDDVYGSDQAAVFAVVASQNPSLSLGSIVGGGYVINNFTAGTLLSSTPDGSGGFLNGSTPDNPSYIYGSLYLSPSGDPTAANVLINLNITPTEGPAGTWTYTFNLNTPTDGYDLYPFNGGATWISGTGGDTLGDVIAAIGSSAYASEVVSYYGVQIGMSGTSDTGFTVNQMSLDVTPEPASMIFFATGLVAVGGYVARRRMLRNA